MALLYSCPEVFLKRTRLVAPGLGGGPVGVASREMGSGERRREGEEVGPVGLVEPTGTNPYRAPGLLKRKSIIERVELPYSSKGSPFLLIKWDHHPISSP